MGGMCIDYFGVNIYIELNSNNEIKAAEYNIVENKITFCICICITSYCLYTQLLSNFAVYICSQQKAATGQLTSYFINYQSH